MGLLTTGGEPIVWGDKRLGKAIPYVLAHGVQQFINIYRRYEQLKDFPFLWGEEIEHLVMAVAPDGTPRVSLTAAELIDTMRARPTTSKWLPEYGSFMVETTPAAPYDGSRESLLSCERIVNERYEALRSATSDPSDRRVIVTLVTFPLMGVGDFVDAPTQPPTRGEFADSIFVPDAVINQTHPRFGNLTRNIRLRRGRKVCIQVPMFIDEFTMRDTVDTTYRIDRHPANKHIDCAPVESSRTHAFESDSDDDATKPATKSTPAKAGARTASPAKRDAPAAAKEEVHGMTHLFTPATSYYYAQYEPSTDRSLNVQARFEACPCPVPSVDHPCVYMDAMAFGMGNACLQVTMQMPNVDKARHVFDQLAIICPMFLAVTAATPIQKGVLCDSDVRWLTIAASVDDRKRSEVPRIIKSRYDSVSLFISPEPKDLSKYNDNHVEVDATVLKRLTDEGFDERLARHVSHLFIRDPLVIFDQRIEQLDDTKDTDHFENVQSTNWQTVRFKPPPFDSDIGWRVEFRVMEVSMTAFENAAFSVFIALLTRAIMHYDLWLYVPMSTVDQNMGRAHRRDPVKEKYWFRRDVRSRADTVSTVELSLDELFNGCKHFEGFVPLVRRYATETRVADPRIDQYCELVSQRASGKLLTTASFIREFVTTHADYKRDSRVTPRITADLIKLADDLSAGRIAFDNFLPSELLNQPLAPAPERKRQRD